MSGMKNVGEGPMQDRLVKRRTIVKGAAWSVPAIAVAMAAPQASASGATYTVTVTGDGNLMNNCSFVLPAGASNISYSVAGGGGGAYYGAGGALLTGTLSSPAADTTVQLVAAGAGLWGGANFTDHGGSPVLPRVGLGGQGFGNGGSAPLPSGSLTGYPANNVRIGGGGGGGSALLIGGVAAVVAGGGGGGAEGDGLYSVVNDGNGSGGGDTGFAGTGAMTISGDAPAGGDYTSEIRLGGVGPIVRSITAAGGAGGTASAGGSGGAWSFTGGPFTVAPNGVTGGAGTLGSTTVGGNGGDGVITAITGQTWADYHTVTAVSGGGGGGFAGGGAGGGANYAYVDHDLGAFGGSGGGGTNFVGNAGGIVVTNSDVTEAAGAEIPGTVTVTFTAEPGLTFAC